jgi:dihydrofolate reductase
LKAQPGPALLTMGSGEIVSQLTQAGLIDEYQLIFVPLVLGRGRSLFEGVSNAAQAEIDEDAQFPERQRRRLVLSLIAV